MAWKSNKIFFSSFWGSLSLVVLYAIVHFTAVKSFRAHISEWVEQVITESPCENIERYVRAANTSYFVHPVDSGSRKLHVKPPFGTFFILTMFGIPFVSKRKLIIMFTSVFHVSVGFVFLLLLIDNCNLWVYEFLDFIESYMYPGLCFILLSYGYSAKRKEDSPS